ncbi:beta-glucosidase [Cohnella sp. 56]|uniref:beta-glucosidase n=1 Tax=Cohnella sp. 56 TaxID=3113722 RepID=UPI0030EAB5D2
MPDRQDGPEEQDRRMGQGGQTRSDEADKRDRQGEAWIEELLRQLTPEEKVGMIHGAALFRTAGVERLGIPPLRMSDGPMGVRREYADDAWINIGTSDDYVTYFPSNSAIAATWNRELAYRSGQALGAEARGRGKDIILAPGINIKRSPLCGRNFEYMSEDPRLIEELVVPMIAGIQENDVAACVKHFAANNQETERYWVDTIVNERALREIYYPGFKAAVQVANTLTVMSAYNKLNGEFCSHHRYLLGDLLRGEWGFDGVVVSDWDAVHDTRAAAEAPLDIEMGTNTQFDRYNLAEPLLEAMRSGEIDILHVDAKVRNILRLMRRLHMIGPAHSSRRAGTYAVPAHRDAALETARESIVLLKNESERLPLRREKLHRLLVVGRNADMLHAGGGGSAEIKALYEISPLLGLKAKLGGNTEIRCVPGYAIPERAGQEDDGDPARAAERAVAVEASAGRSAGLLAEAVALAKEYDEVIFIGGLNHDYDVESADREDMKLPYGQDELIEALLEANADTVIVLIGGSPVEMHRWSDRARAIIWGWYAGLEGGTALAEALLGDVNPSGRLPETFPRVLDDSPAHRLGDFGGRERVTYNEGVFVGYRYFDTFAVEPAFCFGHGLSYTSYAYIDAHIDIHDDGTGEELKAEIAVTVRNIGAMAGAETVQVYVAPTGAGVERPLQELKMFEKVRLMPGEEKVVIMKLSKDAFGYYDEEARAFVAEAGEFEIRIGSSSRDIRLIRKISLQRTYRY